MQGSRSISCNRCAVLLQELLLTQTSTGGRDSERHKLPLSANTFLHCSVKETYLNSRQCNNFIQNTSLTK